MDADALYRHLVQDSPDMMLALAGDGTVAYVNATVEQLLGFAPAEVESKRLDEFVHPTDTEKLTELLGGTAPVEIRVISKRGVWRSLQGVSNPASRELGSCQVVTLRSVTSNTETAQKLREALSRMTLVFEQAPDAYYLHDLEGKFVDGNQSAERMTGYDRQELIGKSFVEAGLLPESQIPKALEGLSLSARGEATGPDEFTLISKNGSSLEVEIRTYPVKMRSQTLVLGIARDIGGRVRARQALERHASDLQAVNEVAIELALVNSRRNVHQIVCQKLKDLTGACIIGLSVYHPKDRTLEVVRLAGDKDLLGRADRVLGQPATSIRAELSEDDLEFVLSSKVDKTKGLHELTFGALSEKAAAKHEEALGLGEIWGVALHFAGELMGTAAVLMPQGVSMTVARSTLEVFANLCAVTLKRTEIEQNVRSHQQQLRSLASELSLVEERERHRIATEMHDNIGQTLAAAKMTLGQLHESIADAKLGQQLDQTRRLVEAAIEYTRSLTFQLSPPVLYELPFKQALKWLTEQMEEQSGIPVEFRWTGGLQLAEESRVLLFHVVRELLLNIQKHAQARSASVSVQISAAYVTVVVTDDGIGLAVSGKRGDSGKQRGFGLFSIRERLTHLGGQIEIGANDGQGTRVGVTLPLSGKASGP